MKIKIRKNKLFKKIYLILVFSLFLNLSPATVQNAYAWDAVKGAIFHRAIDTVYDVVKGIIMGALKQAAATAINQAMESIMGGGGPNGGALFIQDYNNYLVVQPRQGANTYINDYISQTTKGRGSASNYISASGGKEGFGGSYQNQLAQLGKSATSEKKTPSVTYQGEPSQMFSDGTFKNMLSFWSGINNPVAYQNHIEDVYNQKQKELQMINQTKVQAGLGSPGQEKNGMVVTPGSMAIMNSVNAQDIGNKIIGGATHMPEVITSMVAQIMTKSLQNGIGNAAKSAMDSGMSQQQMSIGQSTMTDNFGSGATSDSPYKNVLNPSNGGTYGQ